MMDLRASKIEGLSWFYLTIDEKFGQPGCHEAKEEPICWKTRLGSFQNSVPVGVYWKMQWCSPTAVGTYHSHPFWRIMQLPMVGPY